MNATTLREMLDYNPITGVFIWKVSPAYNVKAGQKAGGVNISTGYVNIRLNGKCYTAGRLAWLYMTGYWPNFTIDHWNRDKADNSFANLRDVSAKAQSHNRSKPKGRNPLGVMGVTWSKSKGKWKATIRLEGKNKHLGYFEDRDEAQKSYLFNKQKYYLASYTKGT